LMVNEKMEVFDLIENGRNIQVTDQNKADYVAEMIAWRWHRNCHEELVAVKEGLLCVVEAEHLQDFTTEELDSVLCGQVTYDLADWKTHTIYKGGYDAESETIGYFWKVLGDMSTTQQAKFLQFVTGTSHLPVAGFRALQGSDGLRMFCIERLEDTTRVPSSHTCFNRLDLPPYADEETLKKQLLLAMYMSGGFYSD